MPIADFATYARLDRSGSRVIGFYKSKTGPRVQGDLLVTAKLGITPELKREPITVDDDGLVSRFLEED